MQINTGSFAVMEAQSAQMDNDSSASTSKTHLVVTKTSAAVGDATSLSVTSAFQQSADQDRMRAAKVLAIKTAIDAGTYRTPAADVADKLLQVMFA